MRGNLAIPVSTILLGQAYQSESEGILILHLSPGGIALGAAGLVQYDALAQRLVLLPHVIDLRHDSFPGESVCMASHPAAGIVVRQHAVLATMRQE